MSKHPDPNGSVAASEVGRFVTCHRAWFYDKYGAPRAQTSQAEAQTIRDRAGRDQRFVRGKDQHVASARGERHRWVGLSVALILVLAAALLWGVSR